MLILVSPYLDPENDRCFCDVCMTSRKDMLYYEKGTPAKIFGLPAGWARLGLL